MVARVKGPTDHVVIVGAGLAGLSAALRLAGAGRKVTVLERESVPGGRNGLLKKDGYSFDTGDGWSMRKHSCHRGSLGGVIQRS